MSLIACPECTHTISASAVACPSCAHPVQAIAQASQSAQSEAASIRSSIRTIWVITAFLAILLGTGGLLSGGGFFQSVGSFIMSAALGGYIAFGLCWGYKGVRTLIPRGIFLFLPLIGWVIYWFVKVIAIYAYGLLGGGVYEYIKHRQRLKQLIRDV